MSLEVICAHSNLNSDDRNCLKVHSNPDLPAVPVKNLKRKAETDPDDKHDVSAKKAIVIPDDEVGADGQPIVCLD